MDGKTADNTPPAASKGYYGAVYSVLAGGRSPAGDEAPRLGAEFDLQFTCPPLCKENNAGGDGFHRG
jgi:hypothetical protein